MFRFVSRLFDPRECRVFVKFDCVVTRICRFCQIFLPSLSHVLKYVSGSLEYELQHPIVHNALRITVSLSAVVLVLTVALIQVTAHSRAPTKSCPGTQPLPLPPAVPSQFCTARRVLTCGVPSRSRATQPRSVPAMLPALLQCLAP